MKFTISFSIEFQRNGNSDDGQNSITPTTWYRIRRTIQNKYKSTCYYCGKLAKDGHVDHVIPVSKGGTDDISNLVWACRECNLDKSNKIIDIGSVLVNNSQEEISDENLETGNTIFGLDRDEFIEFCQKASDGIQITEGNFVGPGGFTRSKFNNFRAELLRYGLVRWRSKTSPSRGCVLTLRGENIVKRVVDDKTCIDELIDSAINDGEVVDSDDLIIDELMKLRGNGTTLSISAIQRRFGIGFNRASKISDIIKEDTKIQDSDLFFGANNVDEAG